MNLVIVRSGVFRFLRSPIGRVVILALLETALRTLRETNHPAAKPVSTVLRSLMALSSAEDIGLWVLRELPKLDRALRPYSHHTIIAVLRSILKVTHRQASPA